MTKPKQINNDAHNRYLENFSALFLRNLAHKYMPSCCFFGAFKAIPNLDDHIPDTEGFFLQLNEEKVSEIEAGEDFNYVMGELDQSTINILNKLYDKPKNNWDCATASEKNLKNQIVSDRVLLPIKQTIYLILIAIGDDSCWIQNDPQGEEGRKTLHTERLNNLVGALKAFNDALREKLCHADKRTNLVYRCLTGYEGRVFNITAEVLLHDLLITHIKKKLEIGYSKQNHNTIPTAADLYKAYYFTHLSNVKGESTFYPVLKKTDKAALRAEIEECYTDYGLDPKNSNLSNDINQYLTISAGFTLLYWMKMLSLLSNYGR